MPKHAQYLAQEFADGNWRTARRFNSAEAAWNLATCFTKGRVTFKNRPVPRPEGLDDEGDGRSIVKRQYRVRYHPFHDTNGDDIATQLRIYLYDKDENGTVCISRARLELFAKANGFWSDGYATLNNGQVRMNVGNRLRARLRKKPDWSPEWPAAPAPLDDGATSLANDVPD